MSKKDSSRRPLVLEVLESRTVFSLSIGIEAPMFPSVDDLIADNARGGPAANQIDLATVALHEFGHSLGLPHSTDPSCGGTGQPVMCPYYIGAAFDLKSEDITKINVLYPNNSIVANSNDSRWDNPNVTFSFMPDGTTIDKGGRNGSQLNSVMSTKIGTGWQEIFRASLQKWAVATGGDLIFTEVSDSGAPFDSQGSPQGDIRIGSHKFDSPLAVLAHAYFPPPNGNTAAGDAHFASEENWKNLSGVPLGGSSSALSGSSSGSAGSNAGGNSGQLRSSNSVSVDSIAIDFSLPRFSPLLFQSSRIGDLSLNSENVRDLSSVSDERGIESSTDPTQFTSASIARTEIIAQKARPSIHRASLAMAVDTLMSDWHDQYDIADALPMTTGGE